MNEKIFKLSKSIMCHGKNGPQEANEIALREPTADDLFALEMPFRTIMTGGASIEVRMDGGALKRWIARLSGKDAGAFGGMAAKDLRKIYEWLSGELNVQGDEETPEKN